jgi:hypothetical protein
MLAAGPAATTTEVGDVDGRTPGGCCRDLAGDVDGGPLGVLAAGPAAATTEAGDVDGRPPGGCRQDFWQQPPPELETSIAGPLWVLAAGPSAATTEAGDVDGGPPRGAGGRSGSGHH